MEIEFLRLNEACELLGVSVQTLYRMVERCEITYYKRGGRNSVLRFKKSDLIEYLERGKVPAKTNYVC